MPSGSTVFVDTNVLLYSVDPRDAARREKAATWLAHCWREACGRISTQVLHEAYVNLRRLAPKMDIAQSRIWVRRYRTWGPWVVDDGTVDHAWSLQDRFALSYWDALVAAAAQQLGCSYLLTEDLQHEQTLDDLVVINPFIVGPDRLHAKS